MEARLGVCGWRAMIVSRDVGRQCFAGINLDSRGFLFDRIFGSSIDSCIRVVAQWRMLARH
jgi:hypothetical protein